MAQDISQVIFTHDVTLKGRRVVPRLHDHVLREMDTIPALCELLRHQSTLVRTPAIRIVR